jgi:hypothetical protein
MSVPAAVLYAVVGSDIDHMLDQEVTKERPA